VDNSALRLAHVRPVSALSTFRIVNEVFARARDELWRPGRVPTWADGR
jgi:hypothetical protein